MDFLSQHEWWSVFFRWLHIISGIMWIGHLWYFNFTQTPTVPKIPAELRPAIVRYILPEALFWFRWGAVATLVFGLILAWLQGYLGSALAPEPDAAAARAAIGEMVRFCIETSREDTLLPQGGRRPVI